MKANEIAVGTALVPLETIEAHEQTVRIARHMMKGWLAYATRLLPSHEVALLERQIVNLGEVADFFAAVGEQHREWLGDEKRTDLIDRLAC